MTMSLEDAVFYADVQRENSERKLAEEELREREVRNPATSRVEHHRTVLLERGWYGY
jgi:hypothetical protein